ncbi:MAG: DUF2500 domain-containing protein [Lachnospiraceae bacterium]|nr:DUF2500 domain-containing protein [Lachnospiraceae bacterium]
MTRYNMFGAFNITIFMFVIMLVIMLVIFAVIVITIFSKTNTSIHNNNAPRITVDAVVIGKRQDMTRHSESYAQTKYFVAFQADDGRRVELEMEGQQYGLLIEGDYGKLTFQGTKYLGFTRT